MTDLKVRIVGTTQFHPNFVDDVFEPSNDVYAMNGSVLVEFAGRACYQSWDKPNPATATNKGYVNHLLDVGHFSVLEHSSVSFYIEGISRSLSHELVRHRHFAYSQLSQRYVSSSDTNFIMPPEAVGDEYMEEIINAHSKYSVEAYDRLVGHLEKKLQENPEGLSGLERRKRARQTARAVLPNDTETKLVITGNYRAWRHFIGMRATSGADTEIRALAIEILKNLKHVSESVFGDYVIGYHTDGTLVASTDKASEV